MVLPRLSVAAITNVAGPDGSDDMGNGRVGSIATPLSRYTIELNEDRFAMVACGMMVSVEKYVVPCAGAEIVIGATGAGYVPSPLIS